MFHATTIVAVKADAGGAMAGDGQVTFGEATIMKSSAKKVRRLYEGRVVAGFAGAVADAFYLFDKFEARLTEHRGNLTRSAVEMAKEWRTDRVLRQLQAMLLVMDKETLLVISGNGEIIEPDDGIVAIGSGGPYALAAARALSRHTKMAPGDIVREALRTASEICVYTNDSIIVEEL